MKNPVSFINKLHQKGGTARHEKHMWTSSWAVQKRTKLNLENRLLSNFSKQLSIDLPLHSQLIEFYFPLSGQFVSKQ
jgi:hypothetical protein